eukprot:scaffold16378_cov112-Isochrysis_galbana.AAC.4
MARLDISTPRHPVPLPPLSEHLAPLRRAPQCDRARSRDCGVLCDTLDRVWSTTQTPFPGATSASKARAGAAVRNITGETWARRQPHSPLPAVLFPLMACIRAWFVSRVICHMPERLASCCNFSHLRIASVEPPWRARARGAESRGLRRSLALCL